MDKDRNWTVLLIGGASGVGKSKIAYELARYYQVNVIEIDDISQAVKTVTTRDVLPSLHYFDTGVDWMDIGVSGNVNWLKDVSKDMIPAIKAVIDNHIESDVPIIIEGDFAHPELATSLDNPKVKSIFINEPDKNQILQNYLAREGGQLQTYRADISAEYGAWLVDTCDKLGIQVVESRPWNTCLERVVEKLI